MAKFVPNTTVLMSWFNTMSAEDKISVASMNYQAMYFRAFGKIPTGDFQDSFVKTYSSFDIQRMLTKSVHRTDLWELPKGRLNKDEHNV